MVEESDNRPRAQSEPQRPSAQQPAGVNNEFGVHSGWRRHKLLWATILIVLIVVLVLIVRAHNKSTQSQAASARAAPAAITAGQSKTGNMNVYVDALGTVTPTYTVTVYSQITGRVMTVHYREGEMVAKGASLIDIDPRPYEANLLQAQGSLQHDEGLLAEARIDLARYQAAYAKNAIAKQQLDDQEQTVAQYEGTVKADQGTVAYDQVQLAYCHIVAPIAGRVGLRLVDPGNTVFSGSGSTLVVITQLQPITVVFSVSEDDLPPVQSELSAGHKLQVEAFDRANEKQLDSGTLTSLDNQIDTTTGTLRFRADFPNKTLALFPNQFVNARLLVHTLQNVTLVPTAAIQHNGTAAFVYIVKPDNTVTVQPVTALTSDEQNTAVQGLNAGVSVATSGFDRLENGAAVAVRAPVQSQRNAQAAQSSQNQNNTGQGGNSAVAAGK